MNIIIAFLLLSIAGTALQMILLLSGAVFIGYMIGKKILNSKLKTNNEKLEEQNSTIDRYKIKINHLLGINQEQQNELGKLLDLKSESDDKLTTQRIVINGLTEDIDKTKIKLETKANEIKDLNYRISQFEKNLKSFQ